MTLVECMAAMLILSVAVLAVTYVTSAGHAHLHHGETALRAVRLAENLIEEIVGRPYHGSGATRDAYCIDDYDGFSETAGTLRDAAGVLHPDADQAFNRAAEVEPLTLTIADLDNASIAAKRIVVTVEDMEGNAWSVSRLAPEPTP